MTPIDINEKFTLFDETWAPKIVAALNGQYIKLAKVSGEFVWHSHTAQDEMFLIWKGTLFIDLKEETIELNEGSMFVVPKGLEHRPRTREGETAYILLFEPQQTLHTGDTYSHKTVPIEDQSWI